MIVVLSLDIFALAVAGFFMLYLAMLAILASVARNDTVKEVTGVRRFAIVVPAHNEELSIAKTLRSLFAIEYPQAYFDVVVVADNCTDRTADIARAEGALVYERMNDTLRGKGYALRWCFDQLLATPHYNAIVVIDADSIASKNFLSVMNYYLENGSQAIQCSDMVEPQPGVWSSEVTRLGFTLYNYVRPLGRRVIGCSAGVRGNGMCFSANTLRTIPWNTYSLNEDLEYGLVLLLHNITVDFAPEANVFATMPSNARNAETQRARWEKGRFPVIKQYGGRLLVRAITRLSLKPFDAFVELITPPFVNMFGGVLVMTIINFILWKLGVEMMALFTGLWCATIFLGLVHVFLGLYASRADALLYRAFVYIPRYALWKFIVYIKVFRRSSAHEWVRTTRDHSIPAQIVDESSKH